MRKRALLEQLVEACSSFVTSAPMSQVAADELYAQRADLGPNPSKGRALGQEDCGWRAGTDTDAALLTGGDCGLYWPVEHIADDRGQR